MSVNAIDQLPILSHRAIEPRRVAVPEDHTKSVNGRNILMAHLGDVPGDREASLLDVFLKHPKAKLGLWPLLHPGTTPLSLRVLPIAKKVGDPSVKRSISRIQLCTTEAGARTTLGGASRSPLCTSHSAAMA